MKLKRKKKILSVNRAAISNYPKLVSEHLHVVQKQIKLKKKCALPIRIPVANPAGIQVVFELTIFFIRVVPAVAVPIGQVKY